MNRKEGHIGVVVERLKPKSLRQELEMVQVENQRLHNELSNLQERKEPADPEEIEAKFSELQKDFASTTALSEKLTPDAATVLSQLRAKRKKSPVSLADIEAVLEIIEKS